MKLRIDQLQIGQAFWSPVEEIIQGTTAVFVSKSYIVTQTWNNPGGFQCSPAVADPTKYLNLVVSPMIYGMFITKAECSQECQTLNKTPQNPPYVKATPSNSIRCSGPNGTSKNVPINGTVYFDPNAVSDTESPLHFEDTVPYCKPKCECGGDVTGTTHASYCPKYDKEK